jgi:prepilin-type N-terminal cleavage/methylation domain-containing protein
MKQNLRGFTVIELLVVIAVIGVLASIVLVSLSGTRDRASVAKTLLYSNQIYHSLGADIAGNWNFDEGSGTTALDSSGYNNHGTINGGATYTTDTPQKAAGQGAGKYALSFDGTNDYVATGLTIDTSQNATIEGWAFVTTKSIDQSLIGNGSYNDNFNFGIEGNNHYFWSWANAGKYSVIADAISLNAWYHWALVANNGTAYYYVNGSVVDTLTYGGGAKTGQSIFIGARRYQSSPYQAVQFWHGKIDEVRIYSRALTTFEIQRHYAEGIERHPNSLAIK